MKNLNLVELEVICKKNSWRILPLIVLMLMHLKTILHLDEVN